jgi:SAM-dependent methyltransferase
MRCPVCLNDVHEILLKLKCGNLDDSSLYDPVMVVGCARCGHVFNLLSPEQIAGLARYYDEEYSLNNVYSPNKIGDLPGSLNLNSMRRYENLFEFIEKYLRKSDRILDVGCATGGFLNFLAEAGYSKLHGIEPCVQYVMEAEKNSLLGVQVGLAEVIPYSNSVFDFIVADQVFEHLVDPNLAFQEAARVMKHDGFLCLSVPNASLYDDHIFDFYWFLMREHVQHFDLPHLSAMATKHGFRLLDARTTFSNMTSEKMTLPALTAIFQKKNQLLGPVELHTGLADRVKTYAEFCHTTLNLRRWLISRFAARKTPMYVYGISREFFYLWENTCLKECNILGLVDDTESKQLYFKHDGRKIQSSEILRNTEDAVIITATAHIRAIQDRLRSLNHKGKIIEA